MLCGVATVAMWMWSYFVGIYIELGPSLYLSFARGYCRVVQEAWPFKNGYPWDPAIRMTVWGPVVWYPIDRVGEYPSRAYYLPLWLATLLFLLIPFWIRRKSRSRQEIGGFPIIIDGENKK